MGIKIDKFLNGVLVESVDTRTPEEATIDALNIVFDQRKQNYGSVQDQLDMLYWDQINGTTLWKDHISLVKATYPKPV